MKRLFKVGSDRHDVGRVTFSWHPDGNFLASAGRNGIIHITDRHGDIIDEIPLSTSAPILGLEWDRDGEYLAVLQEGNATIPLWNLSTKRIISIDTTMKDPTFIAWSKSGPFLAIGTMKGSLMIYNKSKKQKSPVVSKHSKKITCGIWSTRGNKLILGSEDRSLTVSNELGDALLYTELKYAPTQIQFAMGNAGTSNSTVEDSIVSANLNGKSLLLYNILDDKEDPLELTFAVRDNGSGCKYGDLIFHHWQEDNLVLIGFSGGYLIHVSTAAHDLGEEKHCLRVHSEFMTTFAYNPHLKRIATAGNDGVRVIDVRDFKECKPDYIPLDDLEDGRINSLVWSPDGQILTVATSAGNIYNFLAKMSVLFAANKTSIGYLSSLREVSVVDAVKRARPTDVTVKLEPSILALGPKHVAAGMNNRVYYHRLNSGSSATPVHEQEYVGIVKEVQINADFAVVLTDSKAILHPIEPNNESHQQTKTFPSREEGSYAKVTCIALTDNFLFYGTEAGTVEIFFLQEWILLSGVELRLDNPVKKLFPNGNGTRVVVIDAANQSFLFNPVCGAGGGGNSNAAVNQPSVNRTVTQFESAPTNIQNVMWDIQEKHVILFFDGHSIHTFIYVQTSIKGSLLVKLGPITISGVGEISLKPDKIELPPGNIPILSYGGVLTCQTSAGGLSTITHPFFDQLDAKDKRASQASASRKLRSGYNRDDDVDAKKDLEHKSNYFCQTLALHKLDKAWEVAVELNKKSFFLALSNKSMELLNVELAYLVYNQLGDAAMVMALDELMQLEDKNLLAGHIAMLFCDYQRAQDLFLASSRPMAALEMRKDLLQYDQSLKLAQILAPNQVPEICIAYGQQLEVRDDISTALKMFEDALQALDHDGNRVIGDDAVPLAMMGIARCQLRLGNVRQGIRMANELDDKALFSDAGLILEQQKQYSEAAAMYVKAQSFEKAAHLYIHQLIKNDKARISEANVILEKVDNNALNIAFGKVCALAGRFDDALRAYRRGKDVDKVVEIQLRHLDQVQQAFDLVRSTSTAQGAQLVAEYCLEQQDIRGAIEFMLIANKSEDAFKLAQSHNMVDTYASFLGDNIASEDAMKVAHYYEKAQDFGRAGRFYSLCGQYSRALRLFLQCGDREIDAAIEVVGKSQNENLIQQLIDFLAGEKDGVPKDSSYTYRLYLALKKYENAAKTALIIAREEQDLGNYPVAHSVVVETIRNLEDANIKVPLQLRQAFVLLHSYLLVKTHVKRNDHMMAARLLLRVVQNISKFPKHVVNILTSTVIECQRAGLKASSYEYAVTLVRPEYRAMITDANLKRKIEAIVRRRYAQNEEVQEETSPCPLSEQLIPITQLECPTTRDALPMCVVSGKHMMLDDWCFCPVSKFPALYSEYVRYIRDETKALLLGNGGDEPQTNPEMVLDNLSDSLTAPDPVMGKSVAVKDLVLISKDDALKYIQRYNNVLEKKKTDSNQENEGEGASNTEEGVAGSTKEGGSTKKSKKDDKDADLEDSTNAVTGSKSKSKKDGGSKSPHRSKIERIHRSKKKRSERGDHR